MLVAVATSSMPRVFSKCCSNAMQISKCSIDAHSGVFSIEESGPSSSSEISSVLATRAMTESILGSRIDRSLVDFAAVRILDRWRETVDLIEIGGQLVFRGGDVFADDFAVPAR